MEAKITIPARIPDPEPAAGDVRVAVHLGWRRSGDGDARVASLRSTHHLPVPGGLADVVSATGTRAAEVLLPAQWRKTIDHVDAIRGARDVALDDIRGQLVAYLAAHPVPGEPLALDVARWRSPARIAALTLRWRDQRPDGVNDGIVGRLESWRRLDKRRWATRAPSWPGSWRSVERERPQQRMLGGPSLSAGPHERGLGP